MSQVHVIVVSPEEAYDGIAEFWCGAELMAFTILSEDALQLRIESRADGQPWLIDTTSLAHGLAEATRLIAAHPEIGAHADSNISAQKGEMSVMDTIGRDVRAMGMHEGGHMGMSQSQMGMGMDMPMLRRATPFDRAFIDMMVPHHQGAIAMAKQLLQRGEQPALRKMADDIISAQTDEIARKWPKAWYGAAGSSGNSMYGSDDSMHGDN